MRSFCDRRDRTWQLEINVSAIKRVKGLVNVDLLAVFEDKMQLAYRLLNDPILLVDTIYALCEPQAKAAGITDIEFGEGFCGDSLQAATESLFEELADFFRSPQQRETLRAILAKGKELEDQTHIQIREKIAAMDASSEVRTFIEKFPVSLESSVSTPAR